MKDFFIYENHYCPPALSSSGDLRSGTKTDLSCLESLVELANIISVVDTNVMDAAILAQMMSPSVGTTFKSYTDVFASYTMNKLKSVKRIDLVWDMYCENSLKKGNCVKSHVQREVRQDVKVTQTGKVSFPSSR